MGSAFCRHDGDPDAAAIPTGIPPDQLKQLMVTTYKTEVVVDETKANRIQLLTMHEHDDKDASTVWLCERRRRITSSSAGSYCKEMTNNTSGLNGPSKAVCNFLWQCSNLLGTGG